MPGLEFPPGIRAQMNIFLDEACCLQSLFDLLLVGVAGFHQRQAALAGLPAQHVHGVLHRDGVHLAEQCIGQRQHFQLQVACLGSVTVKEGLAAVVHQLRLDVGDDADDALAAEGQQGDHLVVVAGVDVQLVTAQLRDLRHL